MSVIILLAFSFLSVVGLVEFIRKFTFWLYKPINTKIYIGVPLFSASETENTIKSIINRIRWMEMPVRLILIDKSDDPKVREIAEKIICKFPDVTLLSSANLDYNE